MRRRTMGPIRYTLSFHLPDDEEIAVPFGNLPDGINWERPTGRTMFEGWMECNRRYPEARNLTYAQIPTRFMWRNREREWVPRIRGLACGRIWDPPHGSRERFYLRKMLDHVKGPTTFEEIRTVANILYPTFTEAYSAWYSLSLAGEL